MKNLLLLLPFAFAACQPKHTPETPAAPDTEAAEAQPSPETGNPRDPSTYIGLPLSVAEETAEKAGLRHRVIRVDGEDQVITMDHLPERLNFAIENGIVTRVTNG